MDDNVTVAVAALVALSLLFGFTVVLLCRALWKLNRAEDEKVRAREESWTKGYAAARHDIITDPFRYTKNPYACE
jgi:hypothetical protein